MRINIQISEGGVTKNVAAYQNEQQIIDIIEHITAAVLKDQTKITIES